MKGLFIPGITEKMFKNASVESVAELMVEGKVYDIDYQEPCEDVMAIHTQGLAEGIRCAMCTNSIKSDRGCDGGCIVDEDMYKNVVDTIRNYIVPPATPIRKVGEWIKRNNDYFDWYECSECGYGSDGEMRYSREYDVRTNYCPKCGTQMLEVDA